MIWIVLCLLAAAAAVLLVLRARKEQAQASLMLERMRASALFREVSAQLHRLRPDHIERLSLQPEQLDVLMLDGSSLCFRFMEHRFDPLQPGPLLALTQAIALELPDLQDPSFYTFEEAPRRTHEVWYRYTMRHDRKDYLLRQLRGRELRSL